MKKLVLIVLGLPLLGWFMLRAQVQPQIQGAGAPSNPCYNGGQEYVDTTNHVLYSCPSNGANWVNRGLGNLTGSGGVTVQGAVTANHVATFVDSTTIKDGGAAGVGTVTNTGASLPANNFVFGNTSPDIKDAGFSVVPPANGGVGKFSTALQDYWLLPYGNAVQMNANVATGVFTTNHTRGLLIQVYGTVIFTRMSIDVTTTSNGNKYYIGLYSKDKTTLLRQGIFSLGAGTGVLTVTVASTTLTPGSYWLTWGADNAAALVAGMTAAAGNFPVLFNGGATPYLGDSDGLIAAGSLPASVGTITAANVTVPLVLLEP